MGEAYLAKVGAGGQRGDVPSKQHVLGLEVGVNYAALGVQKVQALAHLQVCAGERGGAGRRKRRGVRVWAAGKGQEGGGMNHRDEANMENTTRHTALLHENLHKQLQSGNNNTEKPNHKQPTSGRTGRRVAWQEASTNRLDNVADNGQRDAPVLVCLDQRKEVVTKHLKHHAHICPCECAEADARGGEEEDGRARNAHGC
jgi:hypothetical protein